MSWFDAAGLANIAKSALKEAQRTIDKALDIQNHGAIDINTNVVNEDLIVPLVETQPENVNDKERESQGNIHGSMWGSFTGSFFDHSREYNKSVSLEGLDDSAVINSQQFSQSKLVVEHNDEFENLDKENNDPIVDNFESSHMEDTFLNENKSLEISSPLFYDSMQKVKSVPSSSQDESQSSCSTEMITEIPLDACAGLEKAGQNVSTDTKISRLYQDMDSGRTVLSSAIKCGTTSVKAAPILETKDDVDSQKLTEEKIAINTSPTKVFPLPDAITVPPSRNNIQIPLSNVLDDSILIDAQPQSSKLGIPHILRSSNIIDIPLDDSSLQSSSENPLEISTDEGSQSDRTLRGSGDIQEALSESSTSENNATNLKSLIAEAMSDKDSLSAGTFIETESNSVHNDGGSSENLSITQLEMPPRENSPLSSDKSDLVKIGSDHTSGHTSGDEIETATSSDIEIISSPNGDSSSTQSRHSPAKLSCRKVPKDECQVDTLLCKMTMKNVKGHTRELSEASTISDDIHSPEVDKLIRKITEMTEILELRELKIIEVNRRNAELQELNVEVKSHLNSILSKQLESQDLTQVTEEYAQRMSALEKKFQQAIREKDTLRKQLDQVKQESAMRLSKGEFDSIIIEKDEIIKQLRQEGEKLSKQQLQHSNIIKKLRAKEKENETTIKQLKEKVEDFTSETDRLKRTVNAKEEVERTQIEAVSQLTSKNKKLENDLAKMQSEMDDQIQKYETLKKSLDAARKELSDKNKITNQLTAKEQKLESLENEKKIAESQNEEVVNQLQYLRFKLHEYEGEYLEKERHLREENNELLKRLENSESRNEELSQSLLEVSKPLVRQLETLQATYNLKITHLEKVELDLTSKINELQLRLTSALATERISKEECISLRSKVAKLEVDFGSVKHQNDLLEVQLEQLKTEKTILEQEMHIKVEELQSILKSKNSKIETLNQEMTILKSSLEKALDEANQKDISVPSNIRHELDENIDANSNPRSTSPTLSVGKASVAESLASSVWSQFESFEVGHIPRYSNMFEIQMLQTNLQQREGELQQLQWELNRREQERVLINSELTSLTSKVDDLTNNLSDYESLKTKHEELQEQYDVLCQMYGEKVDEVEELRLDLLEAKEAYKSQLNELLGHQNFVTS